MLGLLPTGKVIASPSELTVTVGSAGSELANLVIASTRGYNARFNRVPVEIRIPATALKAGARFTWRADYHGSSIEGAFDVVSRDSADEAFSAIDRALPSEDDPVLLALWRSQLLIDQGYRLEARKALAPLVAGP